MKLKWDWKRIWCHGWGIIKHGWVLDFSKVDAKVSNKTRGWVPRKGDSRGRAQESWMGATKPWMVSARERIHEFKKKKKRRRRRQILLRKARPPESTKNQERLSDRDFPGVQWLWLQAPRKQVWSLVRELDPTGHTKSLHATAKTQYSQINK